VATIFGCWSQLNSIEEGASMCATI
jgi:hypothetical protein